MRVELDYDGRNIKNVVDFLWVVVHWRTIRNKLKVNDWMFEQFQGMLSRKQKEILEISEQLEVAHKDLKRKNELSEVVYCANCLIKLSDVDPYCGNCGSGLLTNNPEERRKL